MYHRSKFHRLRVRFAELELTQGEAAIKAGMAPNTLSTRMTGRVPFTINDIQALCKALDIPLDQISAYFIEDAPARKGA